MTTAHCSSHCTLINSLLDKLRKAEVRVKCEDQLIPALLHADDMVMFAEDEEMMSRALVVLGEWCEEWSVAKVYAENVG